MNTKHTTRSVWSGSLGLLLAGGLGLATAQAQPTTLAEFQFNEGTGRTTASAVNGLVGTLGLDQVPDNVPVIIDDSPSGQANDRAVQLMGTGFLVVDDRDNPILAVADEPLTLEAWVRWDGSDPDRYNGIMGYGFSYKLGLDNGQIIWTLFGIVDVNSGHFLPADGAWHHVAAAYEPGVGVTVYLDGVGIFTAETRSMRAFGHNYFSIGAENLGTQLMCSLDRVRVHKALLTDTELDSVAASPKAPLASTLVAYSFNETAMPFQSAVAPARPTMTSEEYNAANSGPVWSTDSPSGRADDFSLEYAGGARRVIVPDPNTAIRLDNGDFTIQAWAKPGPQTARMVMFFNNAPGGAVSFSVNVDRTVHVTTLGILDRTSSAPIPDDGGWHHLAVVHQNGVEFRFYVDGILRDTIAYTGGVLIDVRTDTQFYIGSEPTGGLPYNGKLDRLIVSKGIVAAEDLDYRPIPGVDPGAPELAIETKVEVSWPTLPAGYVLQSSTTPEDQNSWTDVPGTPQASGGNFYQYFPVTSPKTFYRLIKR
jgi:hypothetical protein